ncbi:E3 ubiquitin-protein ligase CCNB1IP1-like isoform X1 [Amblyomma americanum]
MAPVLTCNLAKCRKKLTTVAWVTSCSHAFCEEDASRELAARPVCPACGAQLPGKFDLVRVDVDPPEHFRQMVLAGHNPETVMDACSRALAFWSYQMSQQGASMEASLERSRQRATQLEVAVERTTRECSALKEQLQGVERERAKLRQCVEELRAQLERLQGVGDAAVAARMAGPATPAAAAAPSLDHLQALLAADNQGEFFLRPAQNPPRPVRQPKPPCYDRH